jgi:uncharacterized membrane protein YcaP (DUF421 family)
MRHERITGDDIREAARNRGIASIAQIEVAILEPDGQFSFIRTDQSTTDPPSKHDT